MAQLVAGNYYRRDWRLVTLISSSLVGSLTVWTGNLLGPIGGSDPLGVETAVQYVETGVALPPSNSPPVGPLANFYDPATDVIPAPGTLGGPLQTDLMYPVGTVSTTIGSRG